MMHGYECVDRQCAKSNSTGGDAGNNSDRGILGRSTY